MNCIQLQIRQVTALLVGLLFIGCSSKISSGQKAIESINKGYIYRAWNEDTVNTILFYLLKNNHFVYLLKNTGQDSVIYFDGTYKDGPESIFLEFDVYQTSWRNYLRKDITGSYLIQEYTDGRKSIFLKILRRSLR